MMLSERIPHHKRCPVATYQGSVCKCYVSDVRDLEAKLAAHLENEGDECPLCQLEAETEALGILLSNLVDVEVERDKLEADRKRDAQIVSDWMNAHNRMQAEVARLREAGLAVVLASNPKQEEHAIVELEEILGGEDAE